MASVIGTMPDVMRTYRYRAYPNPEQRAQLARTFGCARWVYNWGLERRTNAYHGDGTSLTYHSLARSIAGACWGEIVGQLAYKCAWYGRRLVKVDRWFPSSKRCSACGHIVAVLPLSVRRWRCEACSSEHDRDENAAKNILVVGATVTAFGDLGKTNAAIALHGASL